MPLTSEYRIEVLASFEALKIALAKAKEYVCQRRQQVHWAVNDLF